MRKLLYRIKRMYKKFPKENFMGKCVLILMALANLMMFGLLFFFLFSYKTVPWELTVGMVAWIVVTNAHAVELGRRGRVEHWISVKVKKRMAAEEEEERRKAG